MIVVGLGDRMELGANPSRARGCVYAARAAAAWVAVAAVLTLVVWSAWPISTAPTEADRLIKQYYSRTLRLLAEGREEELATVDEVMKVGTNLYVKEVVDHRLFLGVVGRTVAAYAGFLTTQIGNFGAWSIERREKMIRGFRQRLVAQEEHEEYKVTIVRNDLGLSGCASEVLFVCVNNRLWWFFWYDRIGVDFQEERLESLRGRPLGVAVAELLPGASGWLLITGGRDLDIVRGQHYEIVRDSRRIAIVVADLVREDCSIVRVLRQYDKPQPGDVVRAIEWPPPTGDSGSSGGRIVNDEKE